MRDYDTGSTSGVVERIGRRFCIIIVYTQRRHWDTVSTSGVGRRRFSAASTRRVGGGWGEGCLTASLFAIAAAPLQDGMVLCGTDGLRNGSKV